MSAPPLSTRLLQGTTAIIGSTWRTWFSSLSDVENGSVPIGGMIPYAGSTAPDHFLIPDGSAVSRTTYAALYAICGTTYGVGDGSTTFNLPDMRGRVACGVDGAANRITGAAATLGGAQGAETHTLTVAEMPAHVHPITANLNNGGGGGGADVARWDVHNGTKDSDSTGGDDPHNNVQPTLCTNYIIRYE